MESSASTRVLQEPALLYLILCQLSQGELLSVQRVCQTWKRTISDDSRLLNIMWLHPGSPVTDFDLDTTQINPLLQKTFPTIFGQCAFWDRFTVLPCKQSPFMDMWVCRSSEVLKRLKFPNASWRSMIPCAPAPEQLLINVSGEERGTLMWLNFSNRNLEAERPSQPPWLTFGLIYDIVECAWQQANPWRLHCVRYDFPSAALEGRTWQGLIPPEAIVSEEFRASAQSRAGRVRLQLKPDTRSEEERQKVHEEVVAYHNRQLDKAERWGFCGTRYSRKIDIFTDEFHFADALSLDEIEWDEAHEYEASPREPSEPDLILSERHSFRSRLKRRVCATM